MKIIFTALIREEVEGGYSILSPELGVVSQGETIGEAKKNIVEAVELYLESARDIGILEEILEEVGINLKTARDAIILSEYVTTPLQASLV
jgi:Uncharacterised protein family (UPF0150).